MTNALKAVLSIFSLCVFAGEISAEEPWSFEFTFENDTFFGTDRLYTNGVRLSATEPHCGADCDRLALFEWAEKTLFSDETGVTAVGSDVRYGWSVRHVGYTPEQAFLIKDEPSSGQTLGDDMNMRPFGGWFGVSGFRLHDQFEEGVFSATRTVTGLTLGIVGPASLSEEIQKFVHVHITESPVFSWQVRLRNEPTLTLNLQKYWRAKSVCLSRNVCADTIFRLGGALGNVRTQATAQGVVRFGINLPDSFGPSFINTSAESRAAPEGAGRRPFGAYVFAGAEGRAVPFDIFLDGNFLRRENPGTVRARSIWRSDMFAGVGLVYRRFELELSVVQRSKEFRAQKENQTFGSVKLRF